MHEEDYGILWKHHDMHGGTHEIRRSRRLVVSFIATVGNYEYGFYWYFYLDGNIQLEVKLTGIVSPMAITPGEEPEYANVIAPGLAAPASPAPVLRRASTSTSTVRRTACYEVEAVPAPPGPDNPWGNAFRPQSTRLDTELAAQRDMHAATSRVWKVVNLDRAEPARSADRPTSWYRRCRRRRCSPPRIRASAGAPASRATTSGSRPTPPTNAAPRATTRTSTSAATACRAGPRPTARSRTPTSCVWYTFGVTHFVRPEDWPVMPVEYAGFLLSPVGFFDRNPALDVPPASANGSCHT